MVTIHTYTDTKCELEVAKNRLNFLLDKKECLYRKYFPLVSKINDLGAKSSNNSNEDKMADYLHELYEIDLGTGKSLQEEIIYQQENIVLLKGYLHDMMVAISKMSGLEYKLYYEIVINGTSVSKAVEKIAQEAGKDTQTIWKNYYQKIKKEIKKLNKYTVKIQ